MANSRQTEARKSSAFRWAIAGVAVLALVVVAWLIFGARGTVEELITPPPKAGSGDAGEGINQPPAVTPNQDSSDTPAAPPAQPEQGTDGTTQ